MSIQILELNQRDTYLQHIVQLWEENVKVTHTFLTEEEIQNIKQYVPQAVEHVPHLCMLIIPFHFCDVLVRIYSFNCST